jgi:hypothetical protein
VREPDSQVTEAACSLSSLSAGAPLLVELTRCFLATLAAAAIRELSALAAT